MRPVELKAKIRISLYLAAIAVLIFPAFSASPALAQKPATDQGRLYLVGLGSGDHDNITLRALKTINSADLIFATKWDRGQYADLLKGKQCHDAGHGLYRRNIPRFHPTEEYKALEKKNRGIIRKAVAQGKTVAILAGGDPVIFSPQTGYLQEFADLNPKVIPGLSCFNASNAALKQSAAQGHASHSVTLAAAVNLDPEYKGKDSLAKLAETRSTLVFFTMNSKLGEVVEQLKKHYPGNTPMAIVVYAGYSERERVTRATLDTIIEATKGKKLPFEHLIYVGDFLL
jgi:precorrin-4 methylase